MRLYSYSLFDPLPHICYCTFLKWRLIILCKSGMNHVIVASCYDYVQVEGSSFSCVHNFSCKCQWHSPTLSSAFWHVSWYSVLEMAMIFDSKLFLCCYSLICFDCFTICLFPKWGKNKEWTIFYQILTLWNECLGSWSFESIEPATTSILP